MAQTHAAAARMAYLEGAWRLTRRIEDRKSGGLARLEGDAWFTRDGAALRYRERGLLSLPDGPEVEATRDYLWEVAGPDIAVSFHDGRPFHSFPAALDQPSAHHDCPPDIYDVAYDFTSPDRWRAVWTAMGPRKDYALTSVYTRS